MLREQEIANSCKLAVIEDVSAIARVGCVEPACALGVSTKSIADVLRDEVRLAYLGCVLVAPDDALIRDRYPDLDWAVRETALKHAEKDAVPQH